MGIESPYIGLYGVWSVGGIEVRGMGILECGMGWSVGLLEWVVGGSGYFESGLQHSSAPESCATQPRRTVSDDCFYSTPRTPWLSFGTISYASLSVITRMTRWRRKQPVNHPKTSPPRPGHLVASTPGNSVQK